MRRRDFILALGGATAAPSGLWPLAARAQQGERMRRVGTLSAISADDPAWQARIAAFKQRLQQLGWVEGRNLQMDSRYSTGDPEHGRTSAAELVALAPDVLFAGGGTSVPALLQATRTVPIVFANVPDPIGSGIVDSLAHPGGNITGFMQFEYSLTAKWLELLKEIAPGIKRAAVLRDATIPPGIGQFAVIQSVAPSLGVEVSPVGVHDVSEIERAVSAFARSGNGGLIVSASALAVVHRDPIVALAARHKLPAIYYTGVFVPAGGLMSYGPNITDQFRDAAGYVDRILKGETPADLPVQAPTRYELKLNLKTAKALGLEVPPAVLVRADEVIE